MCGAEFPLSCARPDEAASHPACLPITSNIKTLVELLDMLLTSKAASFVDVAMYFATDPKPGQLSVKGKSLSIVLGMPIQVTGNPASFVY